MNYKLILASNSPRRQQLMKDAGFHFEVRVIAVNEDFPKDMPASQVAEYLAVKKGKAHQPDMQEGEIVITADTTVLVEEQVLNKPANADEASAMLRMLSGKRHRVVTGVCISWAKQQMSFSDVTEVTFRRLDKGEIDYYVSHYRPFDKAGAYAIQEWIGMVGIECIHGSYFNVMGLPTEKLYSRLKEVTVLSFTPHS